MVDMVRSRVRRRRVGREAMMILLSGISGKLGLNDGGKKLEPKLWNLVRISKKYCYKEMDAEDFSYTDYYIGLKMA